MRRPRGAYQPAGVGKGTDPKRIRGRVINSDDRRTSAEERSLRIPGGSRQGVSVYEVSPLSLPRCLSSRNG